MLLGADLPDARWSSAACAMVSISCSLNHWRRRASSRMISPESRWCLSRPLIRPRSWHAAAASRMLRSMPSDASSGMVSSSLSAWAITVSAWSSLCAGSNSAYLGTISSYMYFSRSLPLFMVCGFICRAKIAFSRQSLLYL